MSEFSLIVGKLVDVAIEKACIDKLTSIKPAKRRFLKRSTDSNMTWLDCEFNIVEISLFNLASVQLFLDYVAGLEGLKKSKDMIENSVFKHLPWYMYSIWLPVDFIQPMVPLSGNDPFSAYLGSCQALHRNLEKIRLKSKLNLGNKPEGYDLMRSNLRKFSKSNFYLDNEDAVIQWVWYALVEGVALALKNNAPMSGIGL